VEKQGGITKEKRTRTALLQSLLRLALSALVKRKRKETLFQGGVFQKKGDQFRKEVGGLLGKKKKVQVFEELSRTKKRGLFQKDRKGHP